VTIRFEVLHGRRSAARLSRAESKQLADDENTRLQASSSSPTEKEPEATLHILPFGTRGGGGLALGGSF
jgi:hypothetical protein